MRIAIATSSFAKADPYPRQLIEQAGIEIKDNPYGRRLSEDEIIEHLDGICGLIAGLEPLNRRVLSAAKDLVAVARVGIGMDNVDQEAAGEFGIRVSNTPEGPTEAVAEMCLAALLALSRNLISFNRDMHASIWSKRMGFGLRGTKVFLVGYGRIGKRFGEMVGYLGARILIADPAVEALHLKYDTNLVTLDEGLAESEVVSLHADSVDTILGPKEFKQMRSGMILLNSDRGELVDGHALIHALRDGTVGAAWMDAFCQEPYSGPLTEFDNVLLTPHACTYSRQCRRSMEETAVRNLLRDLGLSG